MNTIYFDDQVSDDSRREQLFDGQLFVYSPTPGSLKLIEFARALIREAFGSLDPLTAQHHMPVEKYAAVLAELKPKFIHHPESKKFIPEILEDLGGNRQVAVLWEGEEHRGLGILPQDLATRHGGKHPDVVADTFLGGQTRNRPATEFLDRPD